MALSFKICPLQRGNVLGACAFAVLLSVGCILGGLVAYYLSPCHPHHLGRCGRRLASTLAGLDAGHLTALEDASALCPSLSEAVDCFYWFSQRCLPAREQHFYSKVYVDAGAWVGGLCRQDDEDPPLFVSQAPCMRTARRRRSECNSRFLEELDDGVAVVNFSGDAVEDVTGGVEKDAGRRRGGEGGGSPASLIDSLYDPEAKGTFQMPLCRALREYILCGLRLVGESCGLDVALRLQDLHDNLTSLVFQSKCDADLKPILAGPSAPLPADLGRPLPRPLTSIAILLLLLAVLFILVRRLGLSWE